jgi:hypothetical protein
MMAARISTSIALHNPSPIACVARGLVIHITFGVRGL